MEIKENASKSPSRRPLPTPGSTQPAPSNTSVATDEPQASTSTSSKSLGPSKESASSVVVPEPISTSAFYGPKPPALPSRPKNVGSSHTSVWQQQDPLPTYSALSSAEFREPELVPDIAEDDIPELISAEDNVWGGQAAWPVDSWESEEYGSWNNDFAKIDGRDRKEEENWWDPYRNKENRPGPGTLPPLLAETLHDSDHSLFSVNFPNPNIQPGISSQPTPLAADAPTFKEVCASLPHSKAYYCPKDNGWVILDWGYADTPPRLARSFETSTNPPLPRPIGRSPENCTDSSSNATHHFHRYEQAIDAHTLDEPFAVDQWDTIETLKQRRRVGTVLAGEQLDLDKMGAEEEEKDKMDVDEPEGPLFDLYVCCQCTFYLIRSPVISGVIPRPLWDDFRKEKHANPPPGKSPQRSVAMGMETLLMAIENKLWKNESRMLRVNRPGFQNKIGWSPVIQKLFETLGFTGDTFDTESGLRPPVTDANVPQGKQNRVKLLRAWTEISAWMANYERSNPAVVQHDHKGYPLWVTVEHAREKYQYAIGAHPDQVPRTELSRDHRTNLEKHSREWRNLGMTATTYTPELLTFAYLAQCRCDPGQTVEYFSNLRTLTMTLDLMGEDSLLLVRLINSEMTRGRFGYDDIEAAAAVLGFGADGPLRVEYGSDVPDEFVENAWKECVKRSWRILDGGSRLQTDATNALKTIATSRGSHTLLKVWNQGKNGIMTPDEAYRTLEIPTSEVDDEMLITICTMRLEETSSYQIGKMREAIMVLAEARDSLRLRKFLEIGSDPGEIVPPTRLDLPRGLNQLGNTCYLNSLLQYFYTIKDLRDAVMTMNGLNIKSIEDDKLTDDDLKRHRVGGRLVTRREITRSKKFITLLAGLFHHLECSEDAAVTPALELAKLALVTSKDEEEDEDKGGTDSSNDTDATLVEDGQALRVSNSSSDQPAVSSPTAMDVDNPRAPSPSASGEASSSKSVATTKKAPPLPSRKAAEVSDSTMMFGKQHDVAECMDNCMFQIETALLKFDAIGGSQDDNKTSIVKRLFYGKMRQRIQSEDLQSRSSIHEKEDLFSHLPVNVTDDGVDIYDGLSGYFDDVVDFEGKKARMEVTLVEMPPLLQIQLQRVQFNRETLQPYKSQAYVKFGETIYVDRFLDSADPQKKARSKTIQSELTQSRERIRTLTSHKMGRCASMLEHTHRFLSSLPRSEDADDELLANLRAEQEFIAQEIEHLRVHIRTLKDALEDLWRDSTDAPYELTSVFIHRGSSPSWGHYFFYSRHLPEEPDAWFKYNDSEVSVIEKGEVLADTTGSTANPYLLVFARKGSEVVHTVKRIDAPNNSNLTTPVS